MEGVNLSKIRHAYCIPEQFDPLTGIAIGYAGNLNLAKDAFADRDRAVRTRKPLTEFVYAGKWNQPIEI